MAKRGCIGQCDAFNFRFESSFVFVHAHTLGLSLMCQVDHLDSHFMLQDMFITQNEFKWPNEDV